MLRNGGRNGIALSAGFRWAIGKDSTNNKAAATDKTTKKTTICKQTTVKSRATKVVNPNKRQSKLDSFFAKMNGETTYVVTVKK